MQRQTLLAGKTLRDYIWDLDSRIPNTVVIFEEMDGLTECLGAPQPELFLIKLSKFTNTEQQLN